MRSSSSPTPPRLSSSLHSHSLMLVVVLTRSNLTSFRRHSLVSRHRRHPPSSLRSSSSATFVAILLDGTLRCHSIVPTSSLLTHFVPSSLLVGPHSLSLVTPRPRSRSTRSLSLSVRKLTDPLRAFVPPPADILVVSPHIISDEPHSGHPHERGPNTLGPPPKLRVPSCRPITPFQGSPRLTHLRTPRSTS
jgi:hypothetical protein